MSLSRSVSPLFSGCTSLLLTCYLSSVLLAQPSPSNQRGPDSPSKSDRKPSKNDKTGPPPSTQERQNLDDIDVTVPDIQAEAAVKSLLNAKKSINSLKVKGKRTIKAKHDATAAIDKALHQFRHPDRVKNESAFDHMADAEKAVRRLVQKADDKELVTGPARQIYEAATLVGHHAVSDSLRVFKDHKGEFNSHGLQRKAEIPALCPENRNLFHG